ncbi:hypothetical protein K490DRAFT_57759 [Saccharata proteae CBS 121410]|uniref:Major facilitator superfamily (MFS) profile domain-containing protein n=1 Tax=Saccharata proteae CBS 121410 TaxID=1314787 RepID=A0A9P4HUV5_9PEZI|nr:hypothetical protein K490DRAFT_57759 [Saccharata proteae CBS 121410]
MRLTTVLIRNAGSALPRLVSLSTGYTTVVKPQCGLLGQKTTQVERDALAATTRLNNKRDHWWRDRGLRTLNILFTIPLMSEYVQGYDASLKNNVQELSVWQDEFHHPKGSLLGILSASYWIVNILVVVSISFLSDRFGRRVAMIMGSMTCIIGTAFITGAVNGTSNSAPLSQSSSSPFLLVRRCGCDRAKPGREIDERPMLPTNFNTIPLNGSKRSRTCMYG